MNTKTLLTLKIVVVVLVLVGTVFYFSKVSNGPKLTIIETNTPNNTVAEMSVPERMAFNTLLLSETPENLLYNLEYNLDYNLHNERYIHDYMKADFISSALSANLSKGGNHKKVYKKIEQDIITGSENLRYYMISTLGDSATQESLGILLHLVDSDKLDTKVKEDLLGSVQHLSVNRSSGTYPTQLSPQLGKAWKEINIPNSMPVGKILEGKIIDSLVFRKMETYANAITEIGAPDEIQLLLNDIEKSGLGVKFLKEYDPKSFHFMERYFIGDKQYRLLDLDTIKTFSPIRAALILQSMDRLSNPSVVPVLKKYLSDKSMDDLMLYTSINILMGMGQPEATKAVLEWAVSRRDDVNVLLKEVMSGIRDLTSMELAKEYAQGEASKKFKNVKNSIAVKEAYKEWCGDRPGTCK